MEGRRDKRARWLVQKDMDRVLEINEECFDSSWTQTDLIQLLRRVDCIGMVVEAKDDVLGYAIYVLRPNKIELTSLAVCPRHQRTGVGKFILDKLALKLAPSRRSRIEIEVRETNLPAQLFLKRHGFLAEEVRTNRFSDLGEDAYLMVKRYVGEDAK